MATSNNNKLIYINSSSVCSTPQTNSMTIELIYGKQVCTSMNISHNEVTYYSAIYINYGSDISYITYCSINSNYAYYDYCVSLNGDGTGTDYEIDTCNIINNEQRRSNYPMFYFKKDTVIKDCCILNNKDTDNQNDFTLFGIFSNCSLTFIHCYCQEFIKGGSGDIDTNNIETSEFINKLKFTATDAYCYSGIDQVGDLTPIPDPTTPARSPLKTIKRTEKTKNLYYQQKYSIKEFRYF